MELKTISAQQFVNEMCKRPGTKIGSLFTRTPLKLKVGWERSGRNPVTVVREGRNSMVGVNYTNAVNNQRKREQGEDHEIFVAEQRRWGTRIMRDNGKPTPFVFHTKDGKDKLYMTITVRWEKHAKYEDSITGEPIDPSEFSDFTYARSKSHRQDVEKEVEPRDYTLTNIHGWLYGGTYHTIVHNNLLPTVPTE